MLYFSGKKVCKKRIWAIAIEGYTRPRIHQKMESKHGSEIHLKWNEKEAFLEVVPKTFHCIAFTKIKKCIARYNRKKTVIFLTKSSRMKGSRDVKNVIKMVSRKCGRRCLARIHFHILGKHIILFLTQM